MFSRGECPLINVPYLTIMTAMKTTIKVIAAVLIAPVIIALLFRCSGDTGDINQLREKGRRAMGRGEYKQAVEIYRRAFRLEPSDRDILYGLGMAYKKSFQHDSALVVFRRARILFVHDREINQQLLEVCPQVKDFDCAINAINSLVFTGDNEKQYWSRLADFYYHNEQYDMASKYYGLLMADNPDNPRNYMFLSGSFSIMRKFAEANEVLLKGIERFGPTPEVFINIAVNYINLKNYPEAEDYLRRALELDPGNIPTMINLANVLSSQDSRGKKMEALEIYKNCKNLAPEVFKVDSLINVLQTELDI